MYWFQLVVGVFLIGVGIWVAGHPQLVNELIRSGQQRAGIGPRRGEDPELMNTRTELGLPTGPGVRARVFRVVGLLAVLMGLIVAILSGLKILGS